MGFQNRKYRNHILGEDGTPYDKTRHQDRFDSRREYQRWCELKLMQDAGIVSNLFRQTAFMLNVQGTKVCKYIADFTYTQDGKAIVEDVKGVKTAAYNLKKKLMKACYGIVIKETK